LDAESERAFKKMPKGAGIVNVTVVGTFHFGGSYGHLNGYRYELIAQKISDVAVVYKGKLNAEKEKKAEQQCGCGGVSPK